MPQYSDWMRMRKHSLQWQPPQRISRNRTRRKPLDLLRRFFCAVCRRYAAMVSVYHAAPDRAAMGLYAFAEGIRSG